MNNIKKSGALLWLVILLCSSQALASTALHWWDDIPVLQPHAPPANYQSQINAIPALQPIVFQANPAPKPRVYAQPATFNPPKAQPRFQQADCRTPASNPYFNSQCILKSRANQAGLVQTLSFLQKRNPQEKVAPQWANVSNAALMQTARSLLNLQNQPNPALLKQQFVMRRVHSNYSQHEAKYTGYFTPVVNIRRSPNAEYRYPVYGKPAFPGRYNHEQISRGALQGKGLEIAWTNDRVNLFFAHIQGSAIARYPDGRQAYLDYAGNNYHSYQSIGRYLRKTGYMKGSLSNESIRRWLHSNPQKMDEVLHQNPRYVFFHLSQQSPRTATGNGVIPGHTIAVDDRYITLGAVLLAKIPRLYHQGRKVGHDWRLLFAQDRGYAIRGPGRIDLYVGSGRQAEQQTYPLTGLHDTYLLLPKPGQAKNHLSRMKSQPLFR